MFKLQNPKVVLVIILALLVILAVVIFLAVQPTASERAIKSTYEKWVHAVVTARGDPKPVVQLYTEDALLLPTISADLHFNDKRHLDEYFEKFTALKDLAVQTNEIVIRTYGQTATASGIYTFSYIDENNKPVTIPARFTFVYRNNDGEWQIAEHHSSKLPQPMQAASE